MSSTAAPPAGEERSTTEPVAAQPSTPSEPWYHQGLRFRCTQCGDCCTGGPGFVWLNRDEIRALAARLNLSEQEFERHYVRQVGVRKTLLEQPNGDCVLLDHHRRACTVYEQRPRQCRSWPFWESNVRTPEAWQETCEVCPGSGKGRLVPLDEIQTQLAIIRM